MIEIIDRPLVEIEASEAEKLLKKDLKRLKKMAATMTVNEAGYLVRLYYQMQENRIRGGGQVRAIGEEPHEALRWFMNEAETLEGQIKGMLGIFALSRTVGKWALSIHGIGPVISAGLIANIPFQIWDCMQAKSGLLPKAKACPRGKPCSEACRFRRANTAGSIYSLAGLNPTVKWNKGEKRPWSTKLKRLMWLIGQSFLRGHKNEKDFYGKFYALRKLQEVERNDQGLFAEQAELIMNTKKIGKETDAFQWYSGCYPDGAMADVLKLDAASRPTFLKKIWQEPGRYSRKLPPAHIQQRAERYATKIFISHWHQVGYMAEFGEPAPAPFPIAIQGHAGMIEPPNWPF